MNCQSRQIKKRKNMQTTIKAKDKIANLRDAIFLVMKVNLNNIEAVCIDSGRSRVYKSGDAKTIDLSDIDTPRCNYTLHFIS